MKSLITLLALTTSLQALSLQIHCEMIKDTDLNSREVLWSETIDVKPRDEKVIKMPNIKEVQLSMYINNYSLSDTINKTTLVLNQSLNGFRFESQQSLENTIGNGSAVSEPYAHFDFYDSEVEYEVQCTLLDFAPEQE